MGSCSNCESAFNTMKLLLTDSAGSNLWSGERQHVGSLFNSQVSVNMVDLYMFNPQVSVNMLDLCLTLKSASTWWIYV